MSPVADDTVDRHRLGHRAHTLAILEKRQTDAELLD